MTRNPVNNCFGATRKETIKEIFDLRDATMNWGLGGREGLDGGAGI